MTSPYVPLSQRIPVEDATRRSSLSLLFDEEPVDLHTFIKDRKFLGLRSIDLSEVQSEAVQTIERVYYADLYPQMAEEFDSDYWRQEIPMKNLITLQWGKGSGKDAIARFSSLRVAYLLLCMKSPQDYFGMPDFDSIHLLNIAANSGQAREAFFKPMTEAVRRGWFKDRSEPKQGLIQYDKNVVAISGHSDAEGQEGLNIMLGVADEIDAFRAKNEMVGIGKRAREASTSAESILKMLKGSASTRFPQTYKRVTISYPRYLGSTIQQQTAEGKASIKKYGNEKSIHYVSGPLATWEVNPRVKGREDFQEDYDKDPDEAASMYECKPTRATDAYFRNPIIFRQAVDREAQPIQVDYTVKSVTSEQTGKTVRGWEPVFTFDPGFKPVQGARYAMHGDLAVKGDRAGIAMSHIERWEERVEQVEDETGFVSDVPTTVPVIRNDFVIAFEADSSAKDDDGSKLPREIQIRWARMLCFELIKRGFWIGSFTFDGFQSTDTIQILLSHGVESDRVSTDRDPDIWKTLKDVASDSRLHMPFSQLLQDELESLSRVDGGKVDHPPGGCFVGETRIPLLDGTFPQISELVGKQVWVYSATPEGKIVPGLARGRRTKHTTDLVDVVLDSGYVARCTPEHLWMLRDGSYRQARDLRPGIDRLMPIGFTWPVNGGYVRVTDKDGMRSLGHHMVSEFFEGRKRESYEVVHHKNEVKTDNRPENLEMIDQLTHVTRHADEFWTEEKEARVRAGYAEWASDEGKKRLVYARRRNWRARADLSMEALLQAIRDGATNRAEAARLLSCDWSWVDRKLKSEDMTFEQARELTNNNHKVRAVIPVTLEDSVPVYDLEVDEFHNFALSGGIFVHNSKDLADAFACSILGAITLGGEEDPEGEIAEIGVSFFEVGPAIEPLFGMDMYGAGFGGPELPVGMKGMSLSG